MSNCPIKISGIEFPLDEVQKAVSEKKLLSMEVELSLRCNFRCPYCYVPDKTLLKNELSLDEIKNAVVQAKELGVKKIILLGGEPMLYPYLFEIIEFISSLDLNIEMFTNGFGITEGIADKLLKYKVNVVLKMNSFKEDVQDELSGHKGAYTIIHDAFRNLRSAGYPSRDPFMAVSTIICKQNIGELRELWKWLRDQNIEPYFEVITPQGDANMNEWLAVETDELELLFKDIEKIDREDYAIEWTAQPPLVGNKCLRHLFSCLLSSQGDVMPCVGVPLSVGNIRKDKLSTIINDSEVIQNLRNHNSTIKGPCGKCDKSDYCYGCRGAAYNLTGDYLGSDPICWLNKDKNDQIEYLPLPVNEFIPQKGSMRVIDSLLSVGERSVVVESVVNENMLFVDEDGALDEVVFMEMIAQAIAAMNGFMMRNNPDADLGGFLLGAKKLKIQSKAYVGDCLKISVYKEAKYGDFGILKGTIFKGDQIIAEGEIKVYTGTN